MSAYSEFFLGSSASVIQLELLEISHPSFTKIYRTVRNARAGVTVTLETGESATFDWYPLRISSVGSRDDLTQSLKVDLGDLGAVLPQELDLVAAGDSFDVKPIVLYRTYRSDDLAVPLFGPLQLEVTTFAFKREGSSFEAKAPDLNASNTGELFTIERFPMLRGFV